MYSTVKTINQILLLNTYNKLFAVVLITRIKLNNYRPSITVKYNNKTLIYVNQIMSHLPIKATCIQLVPPMAFAQKFDCILLFYIFDVCFVDNFISIDSKIIYMLPTLFEFFNGQSDPKIQ